MWRKTRAAQVFRMPPQNARRRIEARVPRGLPALACLALALVGGRAAADITSTFDSGTEGWTVVDLPWPDPGSPPLPQNTYPPLHQATGGNPGGHLSMDDPSAGPLFYWRAPPAYAGDRSDAYGRLLRFDLAVTGGGGYVGMEDVVLVGAGLTLVYHIAPNPTSTFTSYAIVLAEAGWQHDNESGPPATSADMLAVLASLDDLYIRGEFLDGAGETGYLDSVALESDLPSDVIFASGFES